MALQSFASAGRVCVCVLHACCLRTCGAPSGAIRCILLLCFMIYIFVQVPFKLIGQPLERMNRCDRANWPGLRLRLKSSHRRRQRFYSRARAPNWKKNFNESANTPTTQGEREREKHTVSNERHGTRLIYKKWGRFESNFFDELRFEI